MYSDKQRDYKSANIVCMHDHPAALQQLYCERGDVQQKHINSAKARMLVRKIVTVRKRPRVHGKHKDLVITWVFSKISLIYLKKGKQIKKKKHILG